MLLTYNARTIRRGNLSCIHVAYSAGSLVSWTEIERHFEQRQKRNDFYRNFYSCCENFRRNFDSRFLRADRIINARRYGAGKKIFEAARPTPKRLLLIIEVLTLATLCSNTRFYVALSLYYIQLSRFVREFILPASYAMH